MTDTVIDQRSGRGRNLSESKHSLLQRLLSRDPQKAVLEGKAITPRPKGGAVPLSQAQRQVWVHSQMAGGMPFYNETITVYRNGPLDLTVLQRCLLEIIRRHEIWRTTFDNTVDGPLQIVHPAPRAVSLPVHDLRATGEANRQQEAERLATEDARRPFDLKTGPLMRALLVRTGDEQYRLYMTLHQIIFDAVTAYNVFLPELVTLYEAFSEDRPSPLPELAIQYGDFAYWQQKSFHAMPEHVAYWRKQLGGELPMLRWPNDGLRPSVESHRGAVQRFKLPENVIGPLRLVCQQEGVSLYMALLALFSALLYRYTGQEEFVIGSVTAGRKRAEVEPLAGYFVNPLALRINLSGGPTFRKLMLRVRETVLDGLAHEDVPFAEVVSQLRQKSGPGRNPLFQIIFSQQPRLSNIAPGWDLATEEIANGGSKLDLFVVLDDRGDGISGPITYNPDLFDSHAITRLLGHWQTMIMAASAAPDRSIADLPLLTEPERRELLFDWNNTATEYPESSCVHELFELQVKCTPDAIAVAHEDEKLTYRGLNARANRLAHHLQRLGTGPEQLVGICVDRSINMLVALLAVLKAGGAYVPLDPAYPKERLAFMINDSGLRLLIVDEAPDGDLADLVEDIVQLGHDALTISRESSDDLIGNAKPHNLAYVIYTSGSTGRPKGVQISHRSLVNMLSSVGDSPGLTQADSLLAVTTISFDIAALELYLPLTVGARCVLASRQAVTDGQQLWKLLDSHEITAMQATPSTWKMLVDAGWPGNAGLTVLCGGENMSTDLAEKLLKKVKSVWNMYGPTETTVWSTLHRVTATHGTIPIGRPMANTQVFILDHNQQPVPLGCTGELYIGGHGVARGYRGRPDLDSEKFIVNPFTGDPGDRLYRTGDLARYRVDGNIECLGRIDNQVKLRGFRIELGEIESVLREHPAVRDVCAIVREDIAGDLRLVAYVVPGHGGFPLNDVRTFLKQKLPPYMVPLLTILEKLPLTLNGKVDRRALPVPEGTDLYDEDCPFEALGPMETVLAGLWSDVLKLDRITAYDNFFDLGGHSLLAIQVVARIEKELGLQIKPQELAFQTLGQLAASCHGRLCAQ